MDHTRLRRNDPYRNGSSGAAGLFKKRSRRAVRGRAVHRNLGGVRNGAGGAGYRRVLVRLRAGGHSGPDTDRRAGRCYRGREFRASFRQKDLAKAAKRDAGGNNAPSEDLRRGVNCFANIVIV